MNRLPDDVLNQLRESPRDLAPDTVQSQRRLFVPLHEANGYAAASIERNFSYGIHDRHRIDVHHAADGGSGAKRPVLVFVHGGGFVAGDKSEPGSPYYDHVGGWATRHGMVAVTITYRLAPEYQWPTATQDIAKALTWVREHIADYGGDPRHIVLMGQSAGGAHVSSYMAGHGGDDPSQLAGAVIMSGIFDPPTADRNELLFAYFGRDIERYKDMSALPGLVASPVPILFALAEFDLPAFHHQAQVMVSAFLETRGVLPQFTTVPGHTHLSEILSLGLDEEAFGAQLARFINTVAPDCAGTGTSAPYEPPW